jgi:hypothetical protein
VRPSLHEVSYCDTVLIDGCRASLPILLLFWQSLKYLKESIYEEEYSHCILLVVYPYHLLRDLLSFSNQLVLCRLLKWFSCC